MASLLKPAEEGSNITIPQAHPPVFTIVPHNNFGDYSHRGPLIVGLYAQLEAFVIART
jgi:hypothetical protein